MLNRLILVGFIGFATLAAAAQADETGHVDLTAGTASGLTVAVYSQLSPLQINRIHGWVLHLSDASGNPVDSEVIEVSGGMPDHDHGLPTQPQVTTRLGAGRYLLEGMRFHMPGRWQISISIADGETAVFDFIL